MKTTEARHSDASFRGIACIELIKAMGFARKTSSCVRHQGVVYQGRQEGMNQWSPRTL